MIAARAGLHSRAVRGTLGCFQAAASVAAGIPFGHPDRAIDMAGDSLAGDGGMLA